MSDIATTPVNAGEGNTPTALVYVSDQNSLGLIRQAFNDLRVANAEFTLGDVRTATTAMARLPSPRLLIVDVTGVEEPGARIDELAQVCEPGTGVIVIGDTNDIRLYRELKREGVAEYLYKPLVRNLVTHACDAILSGVERPANPRSGRLIFMLGVRGGVGATTIAVSTAWRLAERHKRWVMLLDLDLCGGDTALQFNVSPSQSTGGSFRATGACRRVVSRARSDQRWAPPGPAGIAGAP